MPAGASQSTLLHDHSRYRLSNDSHEVCKRSIRERSSRERLGERWKLIEESGLNLVSSSLYRIGTAVQVLNQTVRLIGFADCEVSRCLLAAAFPRLLFQAWKRLKWKEKLSKSFRNANPIRFTFTRDSSNIKDQIWRKTATNRLLAYRWLAGNLLAWRSVCSLWSLRISKSKQLPTFEQQLAVRLDFRFAGTADSSTQLHHELNSKRRLDPQCRSTSGRESATRTLVERVSNGNHKWKSGIGKPVRTS